MSGPVVVGVDGSASGMAAVEAAAREADRLGVGLRLAHAVAWPSSHVAPGVAPWDPGGGAANTAVNGSLDEAERRAHRVAPHVQVTQEVLLGEPAAVLEAESREASLTVVGSRPSAWPGGPGHACVAGRLAAHGRSPVLVVRGRPNPGGPVLLVVDDVRAARAAAEFAFAEAASRGADLVVLDPARTGDGRPRDALDGVLATLRRKHGEVTVRRPRVPVRMRRALVDASAVAQLIVVGRPARHGITGTAPAPAGRAALRHAHCPVAVIRPA